MKKGLASFEFLITLGLIMMVTTLFLTDTLEQSRETVIQSSMRTTVTNQLAEKAMEKECSNPILKQFSVQGEQITIDIEPNECIIDGTKAADIVEKEICSAQPNGDTSIDCGIKTYTVNLQ